MGKKLRVIARGVSVTIALARSAAPGAVCTLLGTGWPGMAPARQEASVAKRPAGSAIFFRMRPVTADLSGSDEAGRVSHIRRRDRDTRPSKGASTIIGNFKR
jgi:hypothetical protein